jgi:hypothetical protein
LLSFYTITDDGHRYVGIFAGGYMMKSPFLVLAGLGFVASCASTPLPTANGASSLLGNWDVSLNFDPSAPPSKTEMRIFSVDDGALKGTFYGSDFQSGRVTSLSTTWILAARTGDQSGAYWHSGRLQADGSIEGQTLSEGRNFLMTWRAVKK